ncbi:hypothetical protein [uncultured Desulfovibrio sp.]|uniref:hypothetical protein n=1 Tax=uncultured Desulfovibrio sp. TaxID=167968 RepID=UPI00262DAD72|nr:hypothetical protein [uncultured Desulfovibrio sp.]
MQNLSALLAGRADRLYLKRSGMATRCRLACEVLAQGRGAALFVRNREDSNPERHLI